MEISINWGDRIIHVPKSYLTSTPNPDVFNLDTDAFRLDLKGLEDSEFGMSYPDTHRHNTEVLLSGVIYARVIEIINGFTITFENGLYAINFYGSNNNYADVTNVNYVSIRPNNAAGLIVDPGVAESLDYNGIIWYDSSEEGHPGSEYPIGTSAQPVNNVQDLGILVQKYEIKHVKTRSSMTNIMNITDFTIEGARGDVVFSAAGFTTNHCSFKTIELTGDFGGSHIHTDRCVLTDVAGIHGHVLDTWLGGTVQITGGENMNMVDCHSSIPGSASPVVDMHPTMGTTLSFRKYSGGLKILNCNTPDSIATLEFLNGKVHLTPSCTDGYISVRGGSGVTLDVTDGSDYRDLGTTVDTSALHVPSILDEDMMEKLTKIYELHGLDENKPLKVTQTNRTFGDVDQTIQTTGTGSAQETTITRN